MPMAQYVIQLGALPLGKSSYSWHVGKEFFEENPEILDADVAVEAVLVKSRTSVKVDCTLKGHVTVPCDRCLEPLTIDVDSDAALDVRQGEEPDDVPEDENGREVLFTDGELDMAVVIYDYTCLAVPLQHTHREGECNPDATKYLSGDDPSPDEESPAMDTPFAQLKDLFKDRN